MISVSKWHILGWHILLLLVPKLVIFVNEMYIVICTVHHVFHYFMSGARVFTVFYNERQLVIVFKDVKQSLPLYWGNFSENKNSTEFFCERIFYILKCVLIKWALVKSQSHTEWAGWPWASYFASSVKWDKMRTFLLVLHED